MEFIHYFTCLSEAMALACASCSSTMSIHDLIGMAEESYLSLGGAVWVSLEVVCGAESLRMALPLSFFLGGIICFE